MELKPGVLPGFKYCRAAGNSQSKKINSQRWLLSLVWWPFKDQTPLGKQVELT